MPMYILKTPSGQRNITFTSDKNAFLDQRKKILFAPLDWGIGHAARCVPLIRQKMNEGHEVVLASNGRSAAFLKKEFPSLTIHTDIPDYGVRYPKNIPMWFHFLLKSPSIIKTIKSENWWLENFIVKEKIDEVYSDNRYGLYSHQVPCYFITHQLNIQAPLIISSAIKKLQDSYLKNFNVCLVPDYPGFDNLSGQLGHPASTSYKVEYIGPLSRFSGYAAHQHLDKKLQEEQLQRNVAHVKTSNKAHYLWTALLSGPEPQRSILEEKILGIFKKLYAPCLIICGRTDENFDRREQDVRIVSHLASEDLSTALLNTDFVICRSGYSTIMDLHALEIENIIFVPTPGQTEQEYLAQYHEEKSAKSFGRKKIKAISQHKLDTSHLLESMQSF